LNFLASTSANRFNVKQLAHFDWISGFDDEVGMIHSIAHNFSRFGITKGVVGLEYAFLPQSRRIC
jgi:hypothetical protein